MTRNIVFLSAFSNLSGTIDIFLVMGIKKDLLLQRIAINRTRYLISRSIYFLGIVFFHEQYSIRGPIYDCSKPVPKQA